MFEQRSEEKLQNINTKEGEGEGLVCRECVIMIIRNGTVTQCE